MKLCWLDLLLLTGRWGIDYLPGRWGIDSFRQGRGQGTIEYLLSVGGRMEGTVLARHSFFIELHPCTTREGCF